MYNAPRMEEFDTRKEGTEPSFGFAFRNLNGDKFRKIFPWMKPRVRTGAFSLMVFR